MHQYLVKIISYNYYQYNYQAVGFFYKLTVISESCLFSREQISSPSFQPPTGAEPSSLQQRPADRPCLYFVSCKIGSSVLIKLPVQILQTKVEHRASQCLHRDPALLGSLCQHIVVIPSAGLPPPVLWSLKSSSLAFSSCWQHPLQLREKLTFQH